MYTGPLKYIYVQNSVVTHNKWAKVSEMSNTMKNNSLSLNILMSLYQYKNK